MKKLMIAATAVALMLSLGGCVCAPWFCGPGPGGGHGGWGDGGGRGGPR